VCTRLHASYFQTQDWALQIRFVQERDSGLYECQLSTHPPSSLFVELVVVGELTTLILLLSFALLSLSYPTILFHVLLLSFLAFLLWDIDRTKIWSQRDMRNNEKMRKAMDGVLSSKVASTDLYFRRTWKRRPRLLGELINVSNETKRLGSFCFSVWLIDSSNMGVAYSRTRIHRSFTAIVTIVMSIGKGKEQGKSFECGHIWLVHPSE
jgi:hypothetical protein